MTSPHWDEPQAQAYRRFQFDFREKTLAGKTVVVAGGTGGLGAATVALLAGEGVRLVVGYRSNKARAAELRDAIEKNFRASLAVIERLTNAAPGNTAWQRDLSITLNKLGDVQIAQSDFAGAQKSYTDGFAVMERLANADPSNTGWQRDLAVSYGKLAAVFRMTGDSAQALNALQRGQAIIARMANLYPDIPVWKNDLAYFVGQIAQLTAAKP